MTRETVGTLTPASSAMARIVMRPCSASLKGRSSWSSIPNGSDDIL
jgi:hypothetical protein